MAGHCVQGRQSLLFVPCLSQQISEERLSKGQMQHVAQVFLTHQLL